MSVITENSKEGYAGESMAQRRTTASFELQAYMTMRHSQWVVSPCHHFLSQQCYSFFFLVFCSQWDCLYMSSSEGSVDKASLYRYEQRRISDSPSVRNRSIDQYFWMTLVLNASSLHPAYLKATSSRLYSLSYCTHPALEPSVQWLPEAVHLVRTIKQLCACISLGIYLSTLHTTIHKTLSRWHHQANDLHLCQLSVSHPTIIIFPQLSPTQILCPSPEPLPNPLVSCQLGSIRPPFVFPIIPKVFYDILREPFCVSIIFDFPILTQIANSFLREC